MPSAPTPEDAIAVGGPLASIEPPVFFDQSGEKSPAAAFFPNPAGISDPRAPLVDARLKVGGQDAVLRFPKGDVDQLVRFLLACLELTEPKIEPMSVDALMEALAPTPAITQGIVVSELLDLRKAFDIDPQGAAALVTDLAKAVRAIVHPHETADDGSNVILAAVRRSLDVLQVEHDAACNDWRARNEPSEPA